ncbi:MAG: hypothetical protein SGPRY_006222 [Prymnesium sp.]
MGGLRCLSIEATILTLQASLNVIDWCMQLLQFVFSPLPHLFSRRTHSKDIVIVGASFGGLAALQELKGRRDVRVTLVDFKEYFEYTPGVLRCFIEPEYLSKLTCELPRKMNTLVIGEVTGVSATAVEVRQPDGTAFELSFDYLVLACGSTYQQPIKPIVSEPTLEMRKASWAASADRLVEASSVIIVGAGAVGVELAGEILTKFPQKKVTIVDMANVILPGFAAACAQYTLKWLQRHGVELRLGEAIASIEETSITLKSGEVLSAGVVYKCVGVMPNTKMLKTSPFKSALGFRDSVIVNDQLQIAGHPHIFAGLCANLS